MTWPSGYPVSFVTFFPDPVPGQAIRDVVAAQARFVEEVAARHPDSPKPVLFGNCQGGWSVMLLAPARRAEWLAPGSEWLQELFFGGRGDSGSILEGRGRPSCRAVPEAEVRNAMESSEEESGVVMRGRTARLRPDLVPLYALAAAVLCAAGGWYLLKELAPLLRPLILAVFLAYTILPAHHALRRRVQAKFAGPLLALLVAAMILGLASSSTATLST